MISIVDDDESVRESTKALVRSLGYFACSFASAEEFLDADTDDTNCLIVDIQLIDLTPPLTPLGVPGRQPEPRTP